MKHFYLLAVAITLSINSQISLAETIANTYATGDTLTATKLNNIKSAVNSKQDRVTGTCSSGESIGSINADGTVICEVDADTDTLSTLSCTTNQFAKWNGSEWVCSDPTLKSININANNAQPLIGSIRDSDGKVILQESSNFPVFSVTFMLPSDYQAGSDLTMRLMFQSTAPTKLDQVGTVQILADSSTIYIPQTAGANGGNISTNVSSTSLSGQSFGTQGVYLIEGSFPVPSASPGNAISLKWGRNTQDTTFDTHTGDIRVFAIDILYSAIL
jgi:hypothetical protein